MRLPIEDDWQPCVNENGEADYEKHIRMLAEQLREANKVTGYQSKLNYATAKRYYNRQTKLKKFKRSFVHVHDPTYKKGKAKKFSYQYKGPFEVDKIFPLI